MTANLAEPSRRNSQRRSVEANPSRSQSTISRRPSERRKMKDESANSSFLISPSPSPKAERSVSNSMTNGSSRTSNAPTPSPIPGSPRLFASPSPINDSTQGPSTLQHVTTPKRKRQSSVMPTTTDGEDAGCVGRFPTMRLYTAASMRMRKPAEAKQIVENTASYTRSRDEGSTSPRTQVSKRMSELGLLDKPSIPQPDYLATPNSAATMNGIEEPIPPAWPAAKRSQNLDRSRSSVLQRNHSLHTKPLPDLPTKELPSRPSSPSAHSDDQPPATYASFSRNELPPSLPSSKSLDSNGKAEPGPSPKRRRKSPSPPLGARPVSPSRAPTLTKTSKPRTSIGLPRLSKGKSDRNGALSPPLTGGMRNSLVWQDFEITGHLLDDPMDDGTGINGVGFKPTKREEESRKMKRRLQVEAWRAREGKAEREERMKKRIESGKPSSSRDDLDGASESPSKVVRFAEG